MRKFLDIMNEAINEDSLIDRSATPAAYEDQDAQHYKARRKTGFFGAQGSGCIMMAKTTGRIMIVLRSAQVDQPHSWGGVGGAFDATKERPAEAAKREAYEETGYTGDMQMVPLYVFVKGTFRYSNFLAIVADEFEPHLGWEADRAVWVDYGQWPKPLHFGLKALFDDEKSSKVIKHYSEMFHNDDSAKPLTESTKHVVHARGSAKGSKHTRCGKKIKYVGYGSWNMCDGSHDQVAERGCDENVSCPDCSSLQEDLTVPTGVDITKAIGAGQDIVNDHSSDDTNTNASVSPPTQTTNTQNNNTNSQTTNTNSQNNTQANNTTNSQPSKSLAPIQPQ